MEAGQKPIPVVSVGNLTVGGTGKTPVVEKFARALQDAGRKVAILSRGYRSKPPPLSRRLLDRLLLRTEQTPPRVVSDGKSLLLNNGRGGFWLAPTAFNFFALLGISVYIIQGFHPVSGSVQGEVIGKKENSLN